jgi:tetratricopeptide (TPR) repeat protein
MGMLLHAFEQYESAEACYRRAHSRSAPFPVGYYLGLTQVINGKNDEAAATLQRPQPRCGVPAARLKLAETLLTLGRLDDAEQTCARSLKALPAWPRSTTGWAVAAARASKRRIDHYRKACQLWPSFGTAHMPWRWLARDRATAEGQQHMDAYRKFKTDGDPQPEDPLLEAVRSLDNTALAHLMKGVELENAGQLAAAIAEHEEAVRQDQVRPGACQPDRALRPPGPGGKSGSEYRATLEINPNLRRATTITAFFW